MGIFLINDHAALPSFEGWEVYFLTKKSPNNPISPGWYFYKYCTLSSFMVINLP